MRRPTESPPSMVNFCVAVNGYVPRKKNAEKPPQPREQNVPAKRSSLSLAEDHRWWQNFWPI